MGFLCTKAYHESHWLRLQKQEAALHQLEICGFDVTITFHNTSYSQFRNRKITKLTYSNVPPQVTRSIRQTIGHYVRSDNLILRIPFSSTSTFFNAVREVAVSFCINAPQSLGVPLFGLVLGPNGCVIDFFLTIKSVHTPLKPVFSQSFYTLHCFSRILNNEGSLTVVQPLFEQKSILFTIHAFFETWTADIAT